MKKPYYSDKYVVIYNADCREILPYLEPVDLVLTDPPYGVCFEYPTYDDTEENFDNIILPVISELSSQYPLATCMSMRNLWKLPKPKWMLCWYHPGSTRRSSVGGFSIWEPISIYGKGWKVANDAIYLADCVNHSESNDHPCPKPEALFAWVLSLHKSETILDPFLGSGTTAYCAKKLNRRCIGIEISEAYCEISAKRCSQEVMELGI